MLKNAALRVMLNFPEKLWSGLRTSVQLHTVCVGLRVEAVEHLSQHKGKGKAEAPWKSGKGCSSVVKPTFNMHEALGFIPASRYPGPHKAPEESSISLSEQAMTPTQAKQEHL